MGAGDSLPSVTSQLSLASHAPKGRGLGFRV